MELVKDTITSCMKRICLVCGSGPELDKITEDMKEVHAAVDVPKGTIHLLPYSPKITIQCPSTGEELTNMHTH